MSKVTMQTILDEAVKAGRSTAVGNDGIFHLSKAVYVGTRLKLITLEKKDRSLVDIYKRYLEATNGSEFGAQVKTDSDEALKYGVSKLRVFAKFASLNGTMEGNYTLVKRAVAIINAQANADAKNPERKPVSRYENVLKVLRYAKQTAKKAKLSDEEILAALAPKTSTKDPEYAAMEQLASKAKKFAENASDNVVGRYFENILAEVNAQLDAFRAAYPNKVGSDASDESDEGDDEATSMLDEDEEEAAA